MEANQVTVDFTPCGGPLPDLATPMINAMVCCLASEHQRLNDLVVQLAFAAAKLNSDAASPQTLEHALELWDEIRELLYPHLQIEDELIFAWGEAHHAVPDSLLGRLKKERSELHRLIADLPTASQSDSPERGRALAETLLALADTLDSHVERHDAEVLPSILRAAFHPQKVEG